ncbi:hypothetical protein [Nakamurella deserti]|uniref:hypothetical protein n=1 Tax=Nakamurella deserti TaxID=2164074 RepID=UPI000DBE986D|nr:hypothetical protein [Nakamurella deserti]
MDRRAAGAVVLLFVALIVAVLPRVSGPGVNGTASAEPPGPPPAVGTCLRDPVHPVFDAAGWMRPLPEFVAGDCGAAHWGEVFDVIDVPSGQGASGLATCWASDGLQTYLTGDATTEPWSAVLVYDVTATGPDVRQFAGGQRWAACIVYGAEPFTGSLAGVAADDDPPPTLGRCYDDEFAAFDARDTPCRMPHRGELFASLEIDVARPPAQDDIDAWCAGIVGRTTGRSDLAGLTVESAVFVWFEGIQSRFVPMPLPDNAKGATALCGVRVADDRSLTLSLRQIGDGPLPWAG